jgi:hypothetical protein
VRTHRFPEAVHGYSIADAELAGFEERLARDAERSESGVL